MLPYSEKLKQEVEKESGAGTPIPIAELQEWVELAAEICATPISLLSLLDSEWQTVLASVGQRVRAIRRDQTLCAHTISKDDMLILEDTMADVRFAGHPMVIGDPEIRFYAGLPLRDAKGQAIGTLCVIDLRPRTLTQPQQRALRVLAEQFHTRLELRAEHQALEQALRERDRISARLHANERNFQSFMNNGPLLTYLKDAEGRFTFYNSRWAERFRVSRVEWLGRTDFELFPEAQAKQFREHDLEAIRTGRVIQSEETFCENGECVTWRSYKFPCEDEDGQPLLAAISMDVTEELKRKAELLEAHRELEKVGRADELSGLMTRRVLEEELEPAFTRAEENRQSLSLVILDIDDMKQRNARFGLQQGDDAVRRVGSVIKECVAAGDTAVRYGGAEFALLLPDTSAEEAKHMVERFQSELREKDWGPMRLTLSAGIASTQHATRSGRQLFCFADDAMYQAKHTGKNRVVLYRPRG